MKDSAISWTDHTFNGWWGCTEVSPACAKCYAKRFAKRTGHLVWGKGTPRRLLSDKNWNQPLKWNREAGSKFESWNTFRDQLKTTDERLIENGHEPFRRPRVFCSSMADWLDDEVPIEWLARLLQLIRDTPNLDWLLLTKRPENFWSRIQAVLGYWSKLDSEADSFSHEVLWHWLSQWRKGKPPENVWIGTTAENQEWANKRIPDLLKIHALIRFLSCEPLLGEINIGPWCCEETPKGFQLLSRYYKGNEFDPSGSQPPITLRLKKDIGIHWVICGGESGPGARPMHPDWARSLRDQCSAARIPFHFKQWGEWLPRPERGPAFNVARNAVRHVWADGWEAYRGRKEHNGRLLDGREHLAFPSAFSPQPSSLC